jgi:ADP-ribose pyrophosphatase YjhB (NUDIX family)
LKERRQPKLAVDCIILVEGKVLLIERRNPPKGWALPGGFVEYNDTVEDAVRREM